MFIRRLTAVVGFAAAVALAGAGTAFATVQPAPNANNIGMGGYDVNQPNITENQAVVAGDQYGLTIKDGRQGIQMCNGTSGESAKLGLFSTNLDTVYAVQWAVASAAGCPANGPLTGVTFPGLAAVPFGHHVWLNESLVTRVKRVKILVCILFDRDHHRVPIPSESPSIAQPTSGPSNEASTSPSESASPSESPSVNPLGNEPSPSPTHVKQDIGVGNDVPLIEGGGLPGFNLHCFFRIKIFKINTVVFEAQDLDAPTVNPLAGDLAGVQTVAVHVPHDTTFDHASWGVNEDQTGMVPCAGAGFPTAVGGPAAYDSAACQPVTVSEYATYQVNGGPSVDLATTTDAVTELISRNPTTSANANATVAPNNSLANLNLGPHGTASDASTVGGHFVVFTANAPTA